MTTTRVKNRQRADDLSDRYMRHWEHVRVKKVAGEYDVSYCCSTWPALRQYMRQVQKCTCQEEAAT